jgi:hypothetical protein
MHPVCAVCKKPVDTLVWYDNPMSGPVPQATKGGNSTR